VILLVEEVFTAPVPEWLSLPPHPGNSAVAPRTHSSAMLRRKRL
jgi:hypothetical protein